MSLTQSRASGASTALATRLDLLVYVFPAVRDLAEQALMISQESFNSRLKAEGDECSTNLYISNLPKSLTEVVRYNLHLQNDLGRETLLTSNVGACYHLSRIHDLVQ